MFNSFAEENNAVFVAKKSVIEIRIMAALFVYWD